MSATELKEQGNRWFSNRKFDNAIDCYTKAISRDPNVSVFYTNRALCFLKTLKWDKAVHDCRRALEIESNLVKGHFFLGQALSEQQMYDEAVCSLRRAHDLSREQKSNFGDDIASTLRSTIRKKLELQEEKRTQKESELESYLCDLIKKDKIRKCTNLMTNHEKDRNSKTKLDTVSELVTEQDIKIEVPDTLPTEVKEELNNVDKLYQLRLDEVQALFMEVDEKRKKRDIPDYLCCRISFELMREPVITPAGHTYNKKDIEEHLQKVGHFDPVTRTRLTQDMLIPNLTMKEVIDSFVADNPWVEEI